MIYQPNHLKETDQILLRLEAFGYRETAQQFREDSDKMFGMNIIGLFLGLQI